MLYPTPSNLIRFEEARHVKQRTLLFCVLVWLFLVGELKAQPVFTFINSWGTGGSGNGQFASPLGLAVSSTGQVFVTDANNHRIQRFDANGVFEAQWGSFGSGNGQFNTPFGLAISSTNQVYVADTSNHRVQQFDANGVFQTQWGGLGSGNGQLFFPFGLGVSSTGQVYVADTVNNRIQRFSNSGSYQTQWGTSGTGNGQLNQPTGVAINSSGQVFVVDRLNHRIQRFSEDGTYQTQWGSLGAGNGQFNEPVPIAINAAGQVYVAEFNNHRIQRFDPNGNFQMKWGSSGSGNGEFSQPFGIALTPTGYFYVGDNNNRIQRFFDPASWKDPFTHNFTSVTIGDPLTLSAGKNLIVSNTTTINSTGNVTLAGGTFTSGTVALSGILSAPSGTSVNAVVTNNGTVNGPVSAGEFLTLTNEVSGAGNFTGNIRLTNRFQPGNGVGLVTMENVSLTNSALLSFEIGGTSRGADYDAINASGLVFLDGSLTVSLVNGFLPGPYDSFQLLNTSTPENLTGTFAGLPEGTTFASSGQLWTISYQGGSVTLIAIPEPGTIALICGLALAATGVLWRKRLLDKKNLNATLVKR